MKGCALKLFVPRTAINSGSTGGRYWFGYVFRGGPVTPSDFVTASDVEESFAFTYVSNNHPLADETF